MKCSKLVVPKSWNYWLKKYRFKEHKSRGSKRSRGEDILYFIGHGRVWRISLCDHSQSGYAVQCGDKTADFDRWALCEIAEYQNIPQNEKQFLFCWKSLLAMQTCGNLT